MGLSQLRYFIAVAKLGNMSRTVETLLVSQPNLSTGISRSEGEVGVPLSERWWGKITLNQSGELLLKSVEQAVSFLGADVQVVWNQYSRRLEPLSIVYMTGNTTPLEHFLLGHPKADLIHQWVNLSNVTSLLDWCEVGLAMTMLPPPPEEMAYRRICACNFGMLMRREYPLATLPIVTRRGLAGVHLTVGGSRVSKETFCTAESNKFGLTPIIDRDVWHLDFLISLVRPNNCVSIILAVKYKELSLQNKRPGLVSQEYANGVPTAYWDVAYNERYPLTGPDRCLRAFVQNYFTSIDTRYAGVQKSSAN